MKYTAIRSEGGLIPYDLLEKIANEEVEGQKPADFGLPKGRRVTDEIQRVWSDAQELWTRFDQARENLPSKDPHGTSLTRDRWIGPLLTDPVRLNYDLKPQSSAIVLDGLTFPISHRVGELEDSPPVHIEGCAIELDRKPAKLRTSPRAMVQEFLNHSEAQVWGIVTNGLSFRLLRDTARTSRPTYLEFDLESILEGGLFNEFALFYRLCHRSRLPRAEQAPEECLLEKYYQLSVEEGGRVRDKLRDGVEEALRILGTGFLRHSGNQTLREKFKPNGSNAQGFHRQLLRLIYRLLFLIVAEERHMIVATGENSQRNQSIYREYYSVNQLRERAESIIEPSDFSDLWLGLKQTFSLFSDTSDKNPLAIPPLNGDLFSSITMPDLDATQLLNQDLLLAIRKLSLFSDGKVLQRVNYSALDVEELGSVYESLLDYRPAIELNPGGPEFRLETGSERKTTGSYYTRPELVRELIHSALEPVLEDRLQEAAKDAKARGGDERTTRERMILSITVCDPACGSGHFLLEAARRLGKELARVRTGEDEPSPQQFHTAVRDVVSHCIYGVDLNPLAVDLCKLALWLEGHWTGKPLNFLDNRIKCGNSLVGVLDPSVMADGIPDEAFDPVTGDDKKVASAYKKRNSKERSVGQKRLDFEQATTEHERAFAEQFGTRLDFPEETAADVRRKAELFSKARESQEWWHDWTAANLWSAAFFLPLKKLDDPYIPTHETFVDYLVHGKDRPQMTGNANALANQLHFFHWHLEFPDVFERGGFDIAIGNPPWERIKLQEEEHWSDDSYISGATNKAERARRIQDYRTSGDPVKRARVVEFDLAKHASEAASTFVRSSGRYPLTGVGDINVYAPFAETFVNLLRDKKGRAGIIIPSGLATDHTTRDFFGYLVKQGLLARFYEFENEGFFSAGQGHMVRFALTTLTKDMSVQDADYVFQAKAIEELRVPARHFKLTAAEISLINPNTRTCPIFRSQQDAALTKKLYRRVPVLIDESKGEQGDPWKLKFMAMYHMANDSGLFKTASDLQALGAKRCGPDWILPNEEKYVRLYEAKMLYLYDHRHGDFAEAAQGERVHVLPEIPESRLADTGFMVQPFYWVPEVETENRLRQKGWSPGWLFAWRDVTDARASERTVVFSVIPRVGVGHNAPLLLPMTEDPKTQACLIANFSSIVLDYVARQKVGGLHLTIFILKQLPILPPSTYSSVDQAYVVSHLVELVYTAQDMQPLGSTLGYEKPFDWNQQRRLQLRAELDAYYAHLYGLTRDEVRYILDPTDVAGEKSPSETFSVLKRRELREFGEYRTQRLVLAAFDELSGRERFRNEKRDCTITSKTWTVGE